MSVSVVPTLDMERAIAASGYDVIVGFDEVGRGSLAGPVMVGAAAIRTCDLAGSSPLQVPDGVADSKMLTEHRREAIFEELKSWCASWAVGSASNTEIDDWGISYALGVAALRALSEAETRLGIDGNGLLDGRPVKVGAILDGPNDYITKALNTLRAGRAGASGRRHQSERRPVLRHRRHRSRHRQSHARPAHGRTGSATPI